MAREKFCSSSIAIPPGKTEDEHNRDYDQEQEI
jgi:hypothetical protein